MKHRTQCHFSRSRSLLRMLRPLVVALEKHSSETALLKLYELYGEDVPKDVLELARDAGFIYEEVYLDRNEMARIAGMNLSRDAELAATPPPRATLRAPCSRAALSVFSISTSTTDSWNAEATSALLSSGRALISFTTAVFRPLNEKS